MRWLAYTCLLLSIPALSLAEVAAEAQKVVIGHQIKRTEGLIRLNEVFTARYQELEDQFLKERNVLRSNQAKSKVDLLEKETAELKTELARLQKLMPAE